MGDDASISEAGDASTNGDFAAAVESARRRLRLGASAAFLLRRAVLPMSLPRRGDGHHVLVLPGFTGADRSTFAIRSTIQSVGCRAHAWRLGNNAGPTTKIFAGMSARLLELVEARDGTPISIFGWSLGGVYARLLARRYPDHVRQVVTLGSPVDSPEKARSLVEFLWQRRFPTFDPMLLEEVRTPDREMPPLHVPATAIFSRFDRVVPMSSALLAPGPRIENVEVVSTHNGLGFNPAALYVVADRLTLQEGDWAPFRPPLVLATWYPARRTRARDGASRETAGTA